MSTDPKIRMEEADPELVVGYEQLYNVEAGGIPNFSLLQQVSIDADGQVPSTLTGTVLSQLEPIRRLCHARNWSPLITEFALISDVRRDERPRRDFTSFIRLLLPHAPAVATHYLDALRHMKTDEAERTQIVPHPQLFRTDMGLIRIECASLGGHDSNSDVAPVARFSDDYLTATRANYILHSDAKGTILPSVTNQATLFVRKFLANLTSDSTLDYATKLITASTVLILPFVRPRTRTTKAHMRGEPGGALFVFLRKQDEDNAGSIEDLGRDLAWVLAEARDHQSDANLQLEIEQRRAYRKLLRVFGHGVTNQLKAAGLVGLREQAACHPTVSSEDVMGVLDLLWPVWGIGDLSRIAAMNPGELRRDWIPEELHGQLDEDGYLNADEPKHSLRESAIRALVLSRLAALCAAKGDPVAARHRFSWNGVPVTAEDLMAAKPTPVWPFHDTDFLTGTTLITLGLFEVLANAFEYFSEGGFSSDGRRLDFESAISPHGVLSLRLKQAAIPGDWRLMLRGEQARPESRTINEIRNTVESKLRSPRGRIVETSQLVVSPDTPHFETTWTFSWRAIQWKDS